MIERKDGGNEEENSDLEKPKEIIKGEATTLGGDRLMINGKLIRLDGIRVARGDSNIKAQSFLNKITNKKEVECLIFEYTSNKIPLGWCFVGELEINSKLIEEGFALSY